MRQRETREWAIGESGGNREGGAQVSADVPTRIWERWLRLSAPPTPPEDASAEERGLARRGRFGSVVLLGVLLLGIGAFPMAAHDPTVLARVLIVFTGDLLALLLNRRGQVVVAGGVLALLAEGAAVSSFFWAPQGQLNFMALSLYGLFLVPEMIAAAMLRPRWMLLLTGGNCLFIVVDALLQPRDPLFAHWFMANEYALVARPVMMQFFVALIFFVGMRTTLRESQRADSAEEIAGLRQREATLLQAEADRTRMLDEGVAQIQSTLAQLANGNIQARVPALPDERLWQVGTSINHLVGRFDRYARAEATLQRERAEAHRLARAIGEWRAGRQADWPLPSGTPLDVVLDALRYAAPAAEHRSPSASATRPMAESRPLAAHSQPLWQPIAQVDTNPLVHAPVHTAPRSSILLPFRLSHVESECTPPLEAHPSQRNTQ